jgi:GxxExxY protein
MNADERRCPDSLTDRVIGAVIEVSDKLGAGFLEKVYERALLRELGLRGLRARKLLDIGVDRRSSAANILERCRAGRAQYISRR